MIRPHSRTVAMVRLFRAAAPALRRRGGRLPRQQQPDAVRLEYWKAIHRLAVAPMAAAMRAEVPQLARLLEDANARRRDAAHDESGRAREIVQRAARRAAEAVNDRDLRHVAEQFGKRTSDFQREQLDRQVRQATAVPLASIEKPTVDRIPAFAKENVSLIKSISSRYFDSIQEVVSEAFEEGWSVDKLTDEISYRGDVADSDARRIARDQVGKLNAEVNQDRQEALGVTGYIWRTVKDQRVREEHVHLDGQRFEWDSEGAPGADVDGGPAHPGIAICCRCYSEPDLSDILAGL